MKRRTNREVRPLGDRALRVAVAPGEDRRALLARARALPGVEDAVVTERHLALHLADGAPAPDLAALDGDGAEAPPPASHVVRVRYDGPDLARVAAHARLAEAEVIALHAARTYRVEVVGFLPGFAYLGEVDPRIAAPRLPSPRPRVPAGAVGIAGARTGIYPWPSPGGWNLVGTAVGFVPFDPARGAALAVGDLVRFEAAT